MPIKAKVKSKPNKFIEFIKHSFLAHIFFGYLIITNIEHFLPTAVDQQSRATAIQNTQEAYRQSMRDNVQNMQKIHDVLQTMQALEHDLTQQPVQTPKIEEMDMAELYELSNEYLADFKQLKADAVTKKLEEIDPTASVESTPDNSATEPEIDDSEEKPLSEQEMLAKTQENQQAAMDILSQLQASQNGQGSTVSSSSQGSGQEGNDSKNNGENSAGSSKVEQFIAQQKSNQYIEQNAKGKQQDFSQAMRTAYGENSAYRFDNIAQTIESKPQQAPAIHIMNTSLATRNISDGATQTAKWLMINSWYMIGPFDNTKRQHIHTAFPPENVINLQAKYLGKEQNILTWQYQQFTKTPIIPVGMGEFEIYYAYTQVKSEKAQDVWLAIGSDDQSKLWLNGILVWNSLPQHKGWQLNEGFRKVHLKAGNNEILFRLENGQYSGGYSVAMSSGE